MCNIFNDDQPGGHVGLLLPVVDSGGWCAYMIMSVSRVALMLQYDYAGITMMNMLPGICTLCHSLLYMGITMM